jgi:hypothetical protein
MSLQLVDPPAEDAGAVGQWAVIGIVAMLVAVMLAYDYTRTYSTMATTGAVPTSHNVNPARNP